MEDISIIGVAVVALLLAAIMALFAMIDRRFMKRMLKTILVAVLLLVVTGGSMLLLRQYNHWVILVASVALMAFVCAWWESQKDRFAAPRSFISLCIAYEVGMFFFMGIVWLLLKNVNDLKLLIPPIILLELLFIQKSVTIAFRTYQSCLRHTREHYLYLVANGATQLEASMPTIRRTLRATALPLLRLMAMPLQMGALVLVAGLVVGGASPVAACVLTIMLLCAALCSSVLIIVLFMWLCK